jgi:hypothetical protein
MRLDLEPYEVDIVRESLKLTLDRLRVAADDVDSAALRSSLGEMVERLLARLEKPTAASKFAA